MSNTIANLEAEALAAFRGRHDADSIPRSYVRDMLAERQDAKRALKKLGAY